MTIIDFMRETLNSYPKIAEFLSGEKVHVDFTDPAPVNYGLSSTGDTLVKEDVLGNQYRRHNFTLYAIGQSITDYNRLANSNFLLELVYWLEQLPEQEGISVQVGEKILPGRFIKATTANAMAMSLMSEVIDDGVMYQLQVYAEYFIESEDEF